MGGKSSQSTQQITIPPEVLARYNAVNAKAEQVANTPFQSYSSDPNAFVAPLNATQQAGIAGTNYYANAAQPYYQTAANMTQAGAQAVNPTDLNAEAIQKYMSPYLNNVLQGTAGLLNQQNQQAMAGQTGNAIRSGAFGGDRSGIAAANLAQQQQLANANIFSNILNQGYGQALSTAGQQQQLGLGAAQANRDALQRMAAQYGTLGAGAQAAGLQGAQAQLAAGQTQQQTQQAGLSALYNQFLQQQSYPFQVAQFLANIAEGTGALSGSTTTTNQAMGGFSDRRLKENIKPVGKTFDGQTIYSYNFKGSPKTEIGLMAQEVEKHHPEAVGLAGGYKTVRYDKATEDAAHRGHFAHGGASMGGGVMPFHAGEGFDTGGYVGFDPALMQQIMASYQQMYAPFMPGQGGHSGGLAAAGYVPQAAGAVGQLQTAGALPEMQNPMENVNQMVGMANSIGQLGDKAGAWKYGGKETPEHERKSAIKDVIKDLRKSGEVTPAPEPTSGSVVLDRDDPNYGMKRGGLAGYADGGGIDIPNKAPDIQGLNTGNHDNSGGGGSGLEGLLGHGLGPISTLALKLAGSMNRGGAAGYADGGMPYADSDQANKLKIPDEPQKNHELMTAKSPEPLKDNTMGDIMGLAKLGLSIASMASDRRLKENIKPIGKTFDGQTVYSYNFKGSPKTEIGLIAQEVEHKHPEAVGVVGGYKTVHYGKATENAAHMAKPHKGLGGFLEKAGPAFLLGQGLMSDDQNLTLGGLGLMGLNYLRNKDKNDSSQPDSEGKAYGGSTYGGGNQIVEGDQTMSSPVSIPSPVGMLHRGSGMNDYINLGLLGLNAIQMLRGNRDDRIKFADGGMPYSLPGLGAGLNIPTDQQKAPELMKPGSLPNSPKGMGLGDALNIAKTAWNYFDPNAPGKDSHRGGLRTTKGLAGYADGGDVEDDAEQFGPIEGIKRHLDPMNKIRDILSMQPTESMVEAPSAIQQKPMAIEQKPIERPKAGLAPSFDQKPFAIPQQPRGSGPRSMRNNNPGNIVDGSFARSLPGYAGSDGRFAIFKSPDAGRQAQIALISSYIRRGFDTPAEIANRWAPGSEAGNDPNSYAAVIARHLGIGVNDKVPAHGIAQIANAQTLVEGGPKALQHFAGEYARGGYADGGLLPEDVKKMAEDGNEPTGLAAAEPTIDRDDPNYKGSTASVAAPPVAEKSQGLAAAAPQDNAPAMTGQEEKKRGLLGNIAHGKFISGLGEGRADSWIPLLTGLATWGTTPTRSAVSGVLAGLGAGAQSAQNMREFARQQKETGVRQFQAETSRQQIPISQQVADAQTLAAQTGNTNALENLRINQVNLIRQMEATGTNVPSNPAYQQAQAALQAIEKAINNMQKLGISSQAGDRQYLGDVSGALESPAKAQRLALGLGISGLPSEIPSGVAQAARDTGKIITPEGIKEAPGYSGTQANITSTVQGAEGATMDNREIYQDTQKNWNVIHANVLPTLVKLSQMQIPETGLGGSALSDLASAIRVIASTQGYDASGINGNDPRSVINAAGDILDVPVSADRPTEAVKTILNALKARVSYASKAARESAKWASENTDPATGRVLYSRGNLMDRINKAVAQ